ncbi:hypothetical protein QOZ80_9BG0713660 [Eleusine coracana subsp. coracana]|nr:hypothetical protein QOZ80_9BG0713660 [Eleusine coracana subsp. coracana]
MEVTTKILVFLWLSCLCIRGNASYEYCKTSDLMITQLSTRDRTIDGLHVYYVTVENRCVCTQMNVKLACHGFNPSVHVDPEGRLSLDSDGEHCTLNGGRPIPNGLENAVTFSYKWSSQIRLEPVSSTVACSLSAAPAPF